MWRNGLLLSAPDRVIYQGEPKSMFFFAILPKTLAEYDKKTARFVDFIVCRVKIFKKGLTTLAHKFIIIA